MISATDGQSMGPGRQSRSERTDRCGLDGSRQFRQKLMYCKQLRVTDPVCLLYFKFGGGATFFTSRGIAVQ